MKKFGFTGSRTGLTRDQVETLQQVLLQLCPPDGAVEFHHGLCRGADDEAHKLVRRIYNPAVVSVVGHPPISKEHFVANSCDVMFPPKDYLDRNKDIVDQTDILIACPSSPPAPRSGTWATVRYARRAGKKFIVIRPDGKVQ